MKLRWLTGAMRSLRVIHAHIAADNPRAATHVVRYIREATERLSRFPDSGRPGQVEGTRELVLSRWPYLVVYRVIGDEVQILRVFHAATDGRNAPSPAHFAEE